MGCLHSSAATVRQDSWDAHIQQLQAAHADASYVRSIKITFFGSNGAGRSTIINNLIHSDYHLQHVTPIVNDYCGPDIGPIIMSFLSPDFRCEDLPQCRDVIRENCVSGILTLLHKSQQLYESDPIANGPCHIELDPMDEKDEIWKAIQLVCNYSSESFDNTDDLDYEAMKQLGDTIHKLWNLDPVQETFSRRGIYPFPDNMDYFFDRVQEIMSKDYVPSREDYLKYRVRTTERVERQYETRGQIFILYEFVHTSDDRYRWYNYIKNPDAIVFVAALSDYGSVLEYDEERNAMHESIEMFAEYCNSKWFSKRLRKYPLILLLTKDDLFRNMIRDGISLRNCFSQEKGWNKEPWTRIDYQSLDNEQEDDKLFNECYSAAIEFIQQAYMEVIISREQEVRCHVVTSIDKTIYDAFEEIAEHLIQIRTRQK